MRVAFVGPLPQPGQAVSGGVERVVSSLINELRDEVQLGLFVPGQKQDAVDTYLGCPVTYLKSLPLPGALRYWSSDTIKLRRALAEFDPDLVHFHCASGLGIAVSPPGLITVHGIAERDMVENKPPGTLARQLAQLSAPLVAMIERMGRRKHPDIVTINPFIRTALPDLQRLQTYDIPNPVDTAFIDNPIATGTRRKRRLVSVQRVGPLKNTVGLIDVAASVLAEDKTLELIIYGGGLDGDYYHLCREKIVAAGLTDRIRFAGLKTAREISSALDETAGFVTLSLQETAPMTIGEALCRGTPVVAPNRFGIPHMITPGTNGYLFEPGDIGAQAAALRALLSTDWDHAEIAAKAHERYDPKTIAAQTLAVYRAILARRGRTNSDN